MLSGKYNQPHPTEGRFLSYINDSNKRQRLMAQRFMNDRTLASTQEYLRIAAQAGMHPVTLATASYNFV